MARVPEGTKGAPQRRLGSGLSAPKVALKGRANMADEKQKPWGDALAPMERDGKTVWIDLGPVWRGENGSLQLTLMSEPYHWRAHAADRRIVIKPREEQRSEPAPTRNTSRRGAP